MKKFLIILGCILISAAAITAVGCANVAEGVLVPVTPSNGGTPTPEENGGIQENDVLSPDPIPTDADDGSADSENSENNGGESGNGQDGEGSENEEAKTYYVIFKSGDYEYRVSYTDEDLFVTEPNVPEREGYVAVGWKSYELTYGEDVYVEAEYRLAEYKITFVAEEDSFVFTYTIFDEYVEAPDVPQRKGYTNGRWQSYTLTYGEDITVMAEYDLIFFNITFIADNFKKTITYTIENPEFAEPEVPVKRGFTDGRWQSYDITFEGDITVYAEYTPLPATSESLFNWELNDNEYTLTRYIGTDTTVIIPSTHDGLPVTKIGNMAFNNLQNCNIYEVVTGENVRTIDDYAFYECTYLTSLVLNEGLESIGRSAFSFCAIEELEIPSTVTVISKQAFYHTEIKELIIPDSVSVMGESAFAQCAALISVVIGNGLNEIPKKAFNECDKLTSVVIGKNVTAILQEAFLKCPELSNVEFADAENWYKCEAGIYSKLGDKVKDGKIMADILKLSNNVEYYKLES